MLSAQMNTAMRAAKAFRPLICVISPRSVQRVRAVATAASAAGSSAKPAWEVRMLYDGACPLCMREVEFLRGRDAGKDKIDFVDIASPSYTAEANAGVSYEQAMRKIHAIMADGQVIVGVEVFRRLYEAVGLGYVYAITKYEPIASWVEALYNVWAKYRMEVTGREGMEIILSKRRATDSKMCADETAACEVPAKAGAKK